MKMQVQAQNEDDAEITIANSSRKFYRLYGEEYLSFDPPVPEIHCRPPFSNVCLWKVANSANVSVKASMFNGKTISISKA